VEDIVTLTPDLQDGMEGHARNENLAVTSACLAGVPLRRLCVPLTGKRDASQSASHVFGPKPQAAGPWTQLVREGGGAASCTYTSTCTSAPKCYKYVSMHPWAWARWLIRRCRDKIWTEAAPALDPARRERVNDLHLQSAASSATRQAQVD
jgi:hypothetical protein